MPTPLRRALTCSDTKPLVFDDLTDISIRDAAAGSNLSTEYFARLARSSRIRARMAGGMWFLEIHSLQQFLSIRSNKPQLKKPSARSNICATPVVWPPQRQRTTLERSRPSPPNKSTAPPPRPSARFALSLPLQKEVGGKLPKKMPPRSDVTVMNPKYDGRKRCLSQRIN
jgi:hypothetical protein